MLSQTAEYALRAMSCLAYTPHELTPTPKLARQTRVPSNYLAKVLQLLSGADLITGRRGVGGGYKLARPATDITMLDVINGVTEIGRITSCPLGLPNHGAQLCRLHHKLDLAAQSVIEIFSSVSLADLAGHDQPSLPLCDVEFTEALRAMTTEGQANEVTVEGNGHATGVEH